MKGFSRLQTKQNKALVALVLILLAALLVPSLALAAPNPSVSFACSGAALSGHEAACGHYRALVGLYQTGALVYHAPGR